MGRFEQIVSRRYLFSLDKKALATAMTMIAVSAVSVGVAALIIVLGVMDGAEKELLGNVLKVYPHVQIENGYGRPIENLDEALATVRADEAVRAAEGVINQLSIFIGGNGRSGEAVAGLVVGVDVLSEDSIYPVRVDWADGAQGSDGDAYEGIVLGRAFAEKLGVGVGEKVLLITDMISGGSVNRRASPGRRFNIVGTFESGYFEFDSQTAFVSLATARKLLNRQSGADSIIVKLYDVSLADEKRIAFKQALGPAWKVETWKDIDYLGAFFASIKLQKLALFLILMLIVLVAGLNIVSTLILMVMDKTREIGIMRAFGVSAASIRKIFLMTGAMIGALGSGLGVFIGLAGCYLLNNVIKLDMPPSVYNFDRLPVIVNPMTVLIIVVTGMAVCILSALLPAISAARLNPVEALRHE